MPERALMRLPQGVVLVDSELVIDYANPAAERLLGVGLPGQPLPDPWPEFSLRDLAVSLFGPSPPTRGTLVETDHRFYWVEGVPASTSETAIVIVDDVTERERARQSEREFVENAAHELRTPLAAIVSVMDVLESGAKDIPETRDRFLKHIRVHSEKLSRLARSLLVLARLQTGVEQARLTVVPVLPLLEEIAGRLDPAEEVEVCVRSSEQAGVLADRDLLHRALANVAENSAKHTRAGEIVLEAHGNGTMTEIEIRDTGPGMTEEEQARAFHRFYRSSKGADDGFGLGLAIAEEAVRAIEGTIELESEPGVGTRVRVVVPSAKIIS
jgi:signal transduction histidine kinase